MSNPNCTPLPTEKILEILAQGGAIQRFFSTYEVRPQQQDMLKAVIHSYNENETLLIEAGTGTGKSMAYLIPAILWALNNKQITVISTNTIALQEQLLNKDIPMLAKALHLDFKAILVKGMSNYLCLRKLEDSKFELPLFTSDEASEITRIEAWSQHTSEGCRSDLNFSPSVGAWERVSADSDSCTREKCPYFQSCHFFKARAKAEEAQLLVVNHHLLLSDISRRIKNPIAHSKAGILPPYTRLILDEAHHFEDVATEFLAQRTSAAEILKLLGNLASEKQLGVQGKLPLLKAKLEQLTRKKQSEKIAAILQRIHVDLMAQRRTLIEQFMEVFQIFQRFALSFLPRKNSEEEDPSCNFRVLGAHYNHTEWTTCIIPKVKLLEENAARYLASLFNLGEEIKNLGDNHIEDQTRGLLTEIQAIRSKLENALSLITLFAYAPPTPDKVRWIELQHTKTFYNTHLVNADLDVSTLLAEEFFSRFDTTILCSATLTANRKFDFLRSRLGLTEKLLPKLSIAEHLFDSPFDYEKRLLLVIPKDIPAPNDPKFTEMACEGIWNAIVASKGNAFVLFTSYAMLKSCYQILYQRMKEEKFIPSKQGDSSRQTLINQFRTTDRSVLFGTDSFWEGVDVAGEALRCVIIVKLPFQVPSEPIIEARLHALAEKGENPFLEFSVPNAIVKFKQGFGRLIRHKQDRGCIVCLDSRLVNKSYGQLFLKSLPPCQIAKIPLAELPEVMERFYKQTSNSR